MHLETSHGALSWPHRSCTVAARTNIYYRCLNRLRVSLTRTAMMSSKSSNFLTLTTCAAFTFDELIVLAAFE